MRETGAIERVVLLGPDSPVKHMIQGALEQLPAMGAVVCAKQAFKLTQEDCVLLFGQYSREDCAVNTRWFEELTGAIVQIQKTRPRAALFLSDMTVYGKLFGEQHLLREDEIGYVCHTSEDDMDAQWMRTAEHFCARLAREESLAVKILRADWEHIPVLLQEDGVRGAILSAILKILENGTAGEAYNLSGLTQDTLARKNAECAKLRSPLAPVTVLADIRKAENYAAS